MRSRWQALGAGRGQRVTQGRPITAGSVNFLLKDKGVGATASIDSTGKFAFESPLETGTYSVSVTPPPPQPVQPGKAAPRATSEIPFKYQTPESSGLSFTVKSGQNEYPITLGN